MHVRSTLVLLALWACPAFATVSADMYLSDSNTPLALRDPNVPHEYRDVMVGTKLCVVVGSDSAESIWGKIMISGDDVYKSGLAARDFNDDTANFDGSCLEAVGGAAFVRARTEIPANLTGYMFKTGAPLLPGRWFLWDYTAKAAGACHIMVGPVTAVGYGDFVAMTLSFNQVPSRDFNNDTTVNFKDFAVFAQHWQARKDPDPNGFTSPFDLDADGMVGTRDMRLLSEFWLERTDVRPQVQDPNASSTAAIPQP